MLEQLHDSIAGAHTPPQPTVLQQEDYQTQFWKVASWREIRSGGKVKDSDSYPPILSMFMEDEFGNPISDGVKEEVYDALQSYWIDLHDSGEPVRGWSETGLRRKDDFQVSMERKFPWLKLCEGHWKAKQLWINYFGKWKRSPSNKSSPTPDGKTAGSGNKPTQQLKERTPIEISSDASAPASSKRDREGDEDHESASSKRHKGKERETALPNFHPPRPQAKKTGVRLGRVSAFSPI